MDIQYDMTLRVKIKCLYSEENIAYDWLKDNGYRIDIIDHKETYIYLTGIKKFLEEKKK